MQGVRLDVHSTGCSWASGRKSGGTRDQPLKGSVGVAPALASPSSQPSGPPSAPPLPHAPASVLSASPRVGEALEVHHQHIRQAPQVQLLVRLHVLLAGAAIPAVLRIQLLGVEEGLRRVGVVVGRSGR